MRPIVSAAALADLVRLRAFLAGTNPAAAERAAAVLLAAIASLADFPQRGRPSGAAGVRELIIPFGRSAYVLRYALSQTGEVVVLRVFHGREDRD